MKSTHAEFLRNLLPDGTPSMYEGLVSIENDDLRQLHAGDRQAFNREAKKRFDTLLTHVTTFGSAIEKIVIAERRMIILVVADIAVWAELATSLSTFEEQKSVTVRLNQNAKLKLLTA